MSVSSATSGPASRAVVGCGQTLLEQRIVLDPLQPCTLSLLLRHLRVELAAAAGMWLWPLVNLSLWGDSLFG